MPFGQLVSGYAVEDIPKLHFLEVAIKSSHKPVLKIQDLQFSKV